MKKRKYTGERLETDIVYSENFFEHLHRYALACSISEGKTVLDIACGEGYGSDLLARKAQKVIGMDISKEVIGDASLKYKRENLLFRYGSILNIPLPDNSIDLVVSFETLEHIDQHDQMLLELKRILRHDGVALISSPDKKYYSDQTGFRNEFHIKELYAHEFKNLISQHFKNASYYSQKTVSGSFLLSDDVSNGIDLFKGNYSEVVSEREFKGLYNICLCSDSTLPETTSSLFYEDFRYLHEFLIRSFKSSWRYKVGNLFVRPFSYLKRGTG